ncbi:MAG: type II toxin-antitoxin system Phd/YefM family antitoxin [Oscillospiraceae bacterium]|nr:type II toxin-antitoxin system Phd/YefM family antitoxin [Oscillospiraceae bacterium]
MPQIRPITDLRNTTEISELCRSVGEPIFITKNGYGDMVIMSTETYERNFVMAEICMKLMKSKKQIENGQFVDFDEAFERLREKYGF